MVLVGHSHRHNDVSHAKIQGAVEALLNPELLKSHFAATLDFALVFAGLFGFHFYGTFSASVLEFNFRTHCPAATEVIANHQNYMWNVETAMTRVVGMLFGSCGVNVAWNAKNDL